MIDYSLVCLYLWLLGGIAYFRLSELSSMVFQGRNIRFNMLYFYCAFVISVIIWPIAVLYVEIKTILFGGRDV